MDPTDREILELIDRGMKSVNEVLSVMGELSVLTKTLPIERKKKLLAVIAKAAEQHLGVPA